MARLKRPSTKDLKSRLKGIHTGSLDERIEAMKHVLAWYDEAQMYLTTKDKFPIEAHHMKALSKASKCRARGIGEKTLEAKESGFKMTIEQMEKFCAAGYKDLPSVKLTYKEFQQNKKQLEAAHKAIMEKYSTFVNVMGAMTGGLIKFKVSKTMKKPRQAPAPDIAEEKYVTYSRKQAKELLRLFRSQGVLELFTQELPFLARSQAIVKTGDGQFRVDAKLEQAALLDLVRRFTDYARTEEAPKRLIKDRQPPAPSTGPRRKGPSRKPGVSSGDKIGGRYQPGSAIGLIYELLQDGKVHKLSEVKALPLGGVNVPSRLKRMAAHGVENGKWDLVIDPSPTGDTVKLIIKK